MRIVKRASFLAMPSGTVFCKYADYVFEDLSIKGSTIGELGYAYQALSSGYVVPEVIGVEWHELLMRAEESGESLTPDFYRMSRDTCFDPDQLFVVFEDADVDALIDRLSWRKEGGE